MHVQYEHCETEAEIALRTMLMRLVRLQLAWQPSTFYANWKLQRHHLGADYTRSVTEGKLGIESCTWIEYSRKVPYNHTCWRFYEPCVKPLTPRGCTSKTALPWACASCKGHASTIPFRNLSCLETESLHSRTYQLPLSLMASMCQNCVVHTLSPSCKRWFTLDRVYPITECLQGSTWCGEVHEK